MELQFALPSKQTNIIQISSNYRRLNSKKYHQEKCHPMMVFLLKTGKQVLFHALGCSDYGPCEIGKNKIVDGNN